MRMVYNHSLDMVVIWIVRDAETKARKELILWPVCYLDVPTGLQKQTYSFMFFCPCCRWFIDNFYCGVCFQFTELQCSQWL